MKKVITLALAAAALCAVAAVAVAQYQLPVVTVTGEIKPLQKAAKDPTKSKPRNVSVEFKAEIPKEARVTAKTIKIKLDKNVNLSGSGFKHCAYNTLATKGASACPKGSEIGKGGAKAVVGPNQAPLTYTIRLFSSGANDMSLLLSGGVSVPAPLKGRLSSKGRLLTIAVPAEVQQPVKGLYASVTELSGKIDAVVKKNKKGNGYADETKCGRHRISVTVDFAPNPGNPPKPNATGAVTTSNTCKKK